VNEFGWGGGIGVFVERGATLGGWEGVGDGGKGSGAAQADMAYRPYLGLKAEYGLRPIGLRPCSAGAKWGGYWGPSGPAT